MHWCKPGKSKWHDLLEIRLTPPSPPLTPHRQCELPLPGAPRPHTFLPNPYVKTYLVEAVYSSNVRDIYSKKFPEPAAAAGRRRLAALIAWCEQAWMVDSHFMDTSRLSKFQDLSRTQRIACTKDLRTAMEDRMSSLLEVELQKSLNDIRYEA